MIKSAARIFTFNQPPHLFFHQPSTSQHRTANFTVIVSSLNMSDSHSVEELDMRDVDDEIIEDAFKDALSFTDPLGSLFTACLFAACLFAACL